MFASPPTGSVRPDLRGSPARNAISRHQRRRLVLNHPGRREDGRHSKASCTSSGFESRSTGWEDSIWGILGHMPSIVEHLLSPNESFEQYARNFEVNLGRRLSERTSIYLDTKYWILLRNADHQKGSIQSKTLLDILKRGVEEGKVFCPIGEAVFIEVMRQESQFSREETAKLVDQLSLGVAIVGIEERVYVEIDAFIRSTCELPQRYLPEQLVWRKLSYVLGIQRMPKAVIDPAMDAAIQKAFFDCMCSRSLRDMIETIRYTMPRAEDRQQFSTKMNYDIARHSDDLRNFPQAYDAEVRGIVDHLGGIALDVLQTIVREQGIMPSERETNNQKARENRWKNLLHIALVCDKERKLLPALNIQANLYASLRWDKHRKFKANDLWDFSHASAALGYCDAFFTERSLHTMVTQKHVERTR